MKEQLVFPHGFLWGAAASGPQTEGIKEKKHQNVWDAWYQREPDRFYNNWSANIACDTYTRYKEDVKLMKNINMNSFRTSIQWSRLIDDFETATPNKQAVEFYNNYFDELIANDIMPIVNLYHFDMPQQLMEEYGGFESKHVVDLFVKYAQVCFELFGSKIKKFLVFNEPIVPVEFGYFYDAHVPNKVDPKLGIQVAYNSMLAQARVINLYRKLNIDGEVGTALNITPAYPRSQHPEDLKASEICDLIINRSFLDPAVKGKYPRKLIELLDEHDLLPAFTSKELNEIETGTVDFVGVNYYAPHRVSAKLHVPNYNGPWMPDWYFDHYQMLGRRENPHRDNNEIYPKAIYDIAINLRDNYRIKWYVSEIGISITNEEQFYDEATKMIDDSFRTQLFKEHMVFLHKAISEGSNCFGVHQWTFIDNWSWLNSHKRRYGFYYLDLKTRNRHLKKHGLWFKEMVANNGFMVVTEQD